MTRSGNVGGGDARGSGVKAGHGVLARVAVAFAVVTWRSASRSRSREHEHERDVSGTPS